MYICEIISSSICSLLHFSSRSLYSAKVSYLAIVPKKIKESLYMPLLLNSSALGSILAVITFIKFQYPYINTASEPTEKHTYVQASIASKTMSVSNINLAVLIRLS